MIPVYKIEVYDNTPVLCYTIDKSAFNIKTTKSLTTGIGDFYFTLPSEKPTGTMYLPDLALHDTIKFYFGYDSLPSSPNYVGKVCRIESKPSTSGRVRVIYGKDLGEILLRRLKAPYGWRYDYPSDIATDIADDLGLSTGKIDTVNENVYGWIDAQNPRNYSQILKGISDQWVDALTQVQADYHVDADSNLVWGTRPFRTQNVETLTVGQNILNYTVTKDVSQTYNSITVYGKKGKPNDSALDWGTDMATPETTNTTVDVQSASGQKVLSVAATAGFSADDPIGVYTDTDLIFPIERHTVASVQAGVSLTLVDNLTNTIPVGAHVFILPTWTPATTGITISAVNGANEYQIGDRGIKSVVAAGDGTGNAVSYMPLNLIDLNLYDSINFWAMSETDGNPLYIMLRIGDTQSAFGALHWMDAPTWYFTGTQLDAAHDVWKFYSIPCGMQNQTNWKGFTGSSYPFEWMNTSYITFCAEFEVAGNLFIDGLYFGGARHSGTASDVTSQTSYGLRELAVTEDTLTTDAQCDFRAEALLFQLKDPVTRVDLTVKGNTNVLVGDQIPLTIPTEGINAESYDVTDVSHYLSGGQNGQYVTTLKAVNSSATRILPANTQQEIFSKIKPSVFRTWSD